jgi:hypothetical protein
MALRAHRTHVDLVEWPSCATCTRAAQRERHNGTSCGTHGSNTVSTVSLSPIHYIILMSDPEECLVSRTMDCKTRQLGMSPDMQYTSRDPI